MCIGDDLSFSDPSRCVREGDLSPSDPSMSVGNGSVFFIRIFMNGMGELSRGMGTGESQIHTVGTVNLFGAMFIYLYFAISHFNLFFLSPQITYTPQFLITSDDPNYQSLAQKRV